MTPSERELLALFASLSEETREQVAMAALGTARVWLRDRARSQRPRAPGAEDCFVFEGVE